MEVREKEKNRENGHSCIKKIFKRSSIFNCSDLQMYVKQFSAYGEKKPLGN